eukprot:CAMPEP_0198364266 /NCGR_PEP_ID=MMETSP1450-20131203/152697_1 /TAXON_ID=753684 ORGANISM="Madagascaria erythrocladiodes, Strain CCMP3234" /NCGR_SAMPLE_ID=MMETSP1450 /ASSEMBLY_ACC=CAM_ASM_001115 /LENGTH=63 /DNA_ID=CAMNT_0044071675 /DNA_START=69 /DNA_END=256 /DNA_ORIENTATION=-
MAGLATGPVSPSAHGHPRFSVPLPYLHPSPQVLILGAGPRESARFAVDSRACLDTTDGGIAVV